MIQKKILIVEDDPHLGLLLIDLLQSENYDAKLCKDGLSGLQLAEREIFDLCIFDVMMPGMDGFSLAKKLRTTGYETPIIFLTAKSMIEDKVKGYNIGAEDYIAKPFHHEELLCKIQVILKRYCNVLANHYPKKFAIGDYTFKYDIQELEYQGTTMRLTPKENEVLLLLCIHKDKILKREDAVYKIYGKRDYFLGRSFDVFISKIRKRLKKDPRIKIETVFKVGFILSVQEKVDASL